MRSHTRIYARTLSRHADGVAFLQSAVLATVSGVCIYLTALSVLPGTAKHRRRLDLHKTAPKETLHTSNNPQTRTLYLHRRGTGGGILPPLQF